MFSWPSVIPGYVRSMNEILGTSKQIQAEARARMYLKSTFTYVITITDKQRRTGTSSLLKQLDTLDAWSMRNVTFEVRGVAEECLIDTVATSSMDDTKLFYWATIRRISERTLKIWASPGSSCKYLRIKISVATLPRSVLFEQLMRPLRAMTHLELLIIDVEFAVLVANCMLPNQLYPAEWINDENGSFSSALESSKRSVLDAIMRSLGASLGDHTVRYELRKMLRVEFYPRDSQNSSGVAQAQ